MPAVTLKGDLCTGHTCWPPRPSIEGEGAFTVGGREVHCEGHGWGPHKCGSNTHAGKLASGSSRFTVRGHAIGRVGDPVSCGSKVAQGDDRFTVGG